jgi:hypothetical protein
MSTVLEMDIGVTIVAAAVAVADTWAKVLAVNASITTERAKSFEIRVFIFIQF